MCALSTGRENGTEHAELKEAHEGRRSSTEYLFFQLAYTQEDVQGSLKCDIKH